MISITFITVRMGSRPNFFYGPLPLPFSLSSFPLGFSPAVYAVAREAYGILQVCAFLELPGGVDNLSLSFIMVMMGFFFFFGAHFCVEHYVYPVPVILRSALPVTC